MATKIIDGMETLANIKAIIVQEEEISWEFTGSKPRDKDKKNIITLKELPLGTTPKTLELVEEDKLPRGIKPFWSGKMWTEGQKKQVSAYRKD